MGWGGFAKREQFEFQSAPLAHAANTDNKTERCADIPIDPHGPHENS